MHNRTSIVDELNKRIPEVSRTRLNDILGEVLDIAVAELKKPDGEVALKGLGTLKRAPTPERKGRNPQTGAEILIPAGSRIKFTASNSLKD